MPFKNLRMDISGSTIRTADFVETLMINTLNECNKSEYQTNLVKITNCMLDDPPKPRVNKKDFLVHLAIENGLNMREIESWLDNCFINRKEEFYFSQACLPDIDERRTFYVTPMHGPKGGVPSYYLRDIRRLQ